MCVCVCVCVFCIFKTHSVVRIETETALTHSLQIYSYSNMTTSFNPIFFFGSINLAGRKTNLETTIRYTIGTRWLVGKEISTYIFHLSEPMAKLAAKQTRLLFTSSVYASRSQILAYRTLRQTDRQTDRRGEESGRIRKISIPE